MSSPPPPPLPEIPIGKPVDVPVIDTGDSSFIAGRMKRPKKMSAWYLLDWEFKFFLTPWIIRANWLATIAWFAVGSIFVTTAMIFKLANGSGELRDVFLFGVVAVFSAAMTLITALVIRVFSEVAIVLFNIAESLKSIDEKTKRLR